MPTRRALLRTGGLAAAGVAGAGALAAWWGRDDPAPRGAPAELRIATGPAGAVFREVGGALAEVLASRLPATRIRVLETDATVENLALLSRGATDLAFASLDAAVAGLHAGTPPELTAVARLYDSWLQLVVLADGPVTGLSQLDGQPVAAGLPGSGTRFTTERLLEVTGVRATLVSHSQDAGAVALGAGQVAALFTLTGLPTPAVTRQAARTKLRLVQLSAYLDQLTDRFGELYAPGVVPSSTYPGVEAVETFTTPNLLLVQPSLSAELVEVITGAIFAERARIARGHPEANRINVRTGIATSPVRLHPGAVRYFRSVKG